MLEPGREGQVLAEAGGMDNLGNPHGAVQVRLGIMAPVLGSSHSSSQPLPLLGSPKYYKKVPGEGMPLAEDPQRRGDLYIYFEILFPKRLSPEVKTLLRSVLQPQGQ